MKNLSLKRETLAEIDGPALAEMIAGDGLTMTCFSCLTFISCNPLDCIAPDTKLCLD